VILKYRTLANTAAAVCLGAVGSALLLAVVAQGDAAAEPLFSFIYLTGCLAFALACWAYAKAKGRSNLIAVGMPFLGPLGLLALLAMRDKSAHRA
jgi:hypothetical protein